MTNKESIFSTQEMVGEIHSNITSNIITITEDKAKLCLLKYENNIKSQDSYLNPLSLVISFTLTLLTSNFKEWILPSNYWFAIFVVGLIYFVYKTINTYLNKEKALTIQDIIDNMKKNVKRDRKVKKGFDIEKMSKIWNVLNERKDWMYINEISRETGINNVTVRWYLDHYLNNFIEERKLSESIDLDLLN